jgi:hypothetical protein
VVELIKNLKGIKIWSDSGWQDFDGILIKGLNPTVAVTLASGQVIQCTADHELYTEGLIKIPAGKLTTDNQVIVDGGISKVQSVIEKNIDIVYDIQNVSRGNRFYANGILVSNCKFIIFDETLIAPSKLSIMEGINPIEKQGQVRWYEKPQQNHTYAVALDPSLGTGGDPAAIQVWDLSTMKQVAEWQHNLTIIQKQVAIMSEICKYIAEEVEDPTLIYYSIENNTIGEAALNAIHDIGEENIQGNFLSEPAGNSSGARRYRKGFNTSHRSKISACAKLKLWVETDRMSIKSKSLISELKNFVASGNTYKAKIGETDDLVMSTLLIVRMALQLRNYDQDLSENLKDELEDIIEPMPFILI